MNIHDGLWLMGGFTHIGRHGLKVVGCGFQKTLGDLSRCNVAPRSNTIVKMDQRKVDFTRCKNWLTNFIELSNYCCNMLQSPYPFVMLFVDKVSQIRSTTYRAFHRWYPQIIHLKRMFRYKPSSYWGSTISGNPHIPCEGATYLVAKVTNPQGLVPLSTRPASAQDYPSFVQQTIPKIFHPSKSLKVPSFLQFGAPVFELSWGK